jgi:hypothetical protein
MSITTTSSLPSPIQTQFNKKILATPVSNFIFSIPAMKMQMSRNGGTSERWRRYNPLAASMVPLGNSGITPPPQNLTAVDKFYLKLNVDYKSSLIDLETLVMGNRAQAAFAVA